MCYNVVAVDSYYFKELTKMTNNALENEVRNLVRKLSPAQKREFLAMLRAVKQGNADMPEPQSASPQKVPK